VKRELERVDIPGEHEARERTWPVVAAAFTERSPVPRPSHWPRVAAVALAVSALVAATVSSPGRAVLDEIREVVGVERAQPALFSLPAPGRLLVASDEGVWVVSEDGSRRLLGDYREATWSPFGRFVAVTRENELAALEPDGDVRWTLPRRGVTSPSWAGTETDTRVAYVDGTGVRFVAGDGTGDRLLLPGTRGLVAWQPGPARLLAVASPREIRVLDVTSGRTIWRARASERPVAMSWSPDGKRLLVSSARSLRVFDERGRVPLDLGPGAAPIRAAALAPNGRAVAYVMETSGQSQLWIVPRIRPDANAARRLFAGTGELRSLTWSPDGRWLLVTWANSDQWLFIRADGRGIRAVSNIASQFRSASFPLIEGWCCTR
jgi:dipeptidyl aminopeptidase/acylaminoacyl peptidase